MHDQGNPREVNPRRPCCPDTDDQRLQFAVLTEVLALHPAQLSAAELARELSDTPEDFRERDRIERALWSLVGAGLLRRQGESVLASRAALRFDQLANS